MIRRLTEIPTKLQTIKSPPKELFYEGNLDLIDKKIVAIVGTRRASSYTRSLVKEMAHKISKAGAVVVSGGAMGVDIVAHEAALPNTIAILAGSIDVGFVRSNKKVIDLIRSDGLILSEYEANTEPKPWSFVHRNRLITALADAVIVAEADEKSGSMTSANFALEQGKKLFVLPHRLYESSGTQRLLMEGKATPILSVENLLKELDLIEYEQNEDEFMVYANTRPTLEEATVKFGAMVFEYEILGKIAVVDGRIEPCH